MRIIDADGHVDEKNIPWAELLAAPYRNRAPRVVQDNRGITFIMMEGKLTPKPVGKACSFVGVVEEVMERKDLSDVLKTKIMGENAAKLYSL